MKPTPKARAERAVLTPKQRVKQRHPRAMCEQSGDVWQIFVPAKYGAVRLVAYGFTPREAWAAASIAALPARLANLRRKP